MNKLSDLTILKQLLKEKQNKLSTLKYEYEAIVEQEPYMRNRLKNRQYSIHKLAGEIKSIEKEIKTMESKHLQDSMEILRLSGFTTDSDCGEKVYTKGESTEDQCKDGGPGSGIKGHTTPKKPSSYYTQRSAAQSRLLNDIDEIKYEYKKEGKTLSHGKLLQELGDYGWDDYELEGLKLPMNLNDDDATEMGTFEQLGQNHKTEAMEPSDNPVQAQDGIHFVTWVKPSGLEYQIGDIIQFKGKNVKVTKITGNVVEAQVMDACTKDEEVGEKFKTVMEEFGKGELKSSSGETVTDPEQAKAIAYSEQREATKDASDRRGVQLKVGDLVAVHGKVGKITRILRARDERDDVVEVFFDNSGTYNPDRVDRYYANETTKDSDPKVAEAKKLIDLFGGAM